MEYEFSKNYSELYKQVEQTRDTKITEADEQYKREFFDIEASYRRKRSENVSRRGFISRVAQSINQEEAIEKANLDYKRRILMNSIRAEFEKQKKQLFEDFGLEQRASKISDAEFNLAADWGRGSVANVEERQHGDIKHDFDKREAEWRRKNPKAK